jgi:hypothetical protein
MQDDQITLGSATPATISQPDAMRRRLLMRSALGASIALLGCGGGGGSETSAPPPPPAAPTFGAVLVYGVVPGGGGEQKLYVHRPGATPEPLAPQLTVSGFELTPDRRAVVCIARHSAAPAVIALYRVDLVAPFEVERLSPLPLGGNGSVRTFRISPDGVDVAFTGDLNTFDAVEVFVAPIAGEIYSRVNSNVGSPPVLEFDLPFPQAWSPDGRYLLQGVRSRATGQRIGLRIYERNGTDNSTHITPPLAPNTAGIGEARWLPDSSGVVFAAQLTSNSAQSPFVVRLANPTRQYQLIGSTAFSSAVATDIHVAADGRTVYFLGRFSSSNRSDLYSVPLTANAGAAGVATQVGGPRTVENSMGVMRYALSPDGTRLAYISDEQSVGIGQLLETSVGAVAGSAVSVLNGPLAAGSSVSRFAYTPDDLAVVYLADSGSAAELLTVQRAAPARPQRVNRAATNNGGVDVDFLAVNTPQGVAAVYAAKLAGTDPRELYFTFLNDLGKSTRLNAPLAAGARVGSWQAS